MVGILARNWWVLALRGVIGILFGLAAFVWPGITLRALVLLYGAFALVDGVFAVAEAVVGGTKNLPWWALLLEGVAGIAVGLITFVAPIVTEVALIYLVAAWAVVTGVFEIVAAIRLRREIEGEWALALGGIVSVLFGLVVAARPVAGALAIAWMIGAYAIVFGVVLLVLAFRLRAWARRVPVAGP
jgi:uncharacterized membrane protein HdeD (DUF308 family)